jgi:hypothetical protein
LSLIWSVSHEAPLAIDITAPIAPPIATSGNIRASGEQNPPEAQQEACQPLLQR